MARAGVKRSAQVMRALCAWVSGVGSATTKSCQGSDPCNSKGPAEFDENDSETTAWKPAPPWSVEYVPYLASPLLMEHRLTTAIQQPFEQEVPKGLGEKIAHVLERRQSALDTVQST
jgi:hypothetical protein